MLISEVIFLDLHNLSRLVKCSHSSKLSQLAEQPSQFHYIVASCPQERHLLTGKKTSFQSGCEWGCSLRIIIPLHTKRNTPSGKLLHARNTWVPCLECSIAKKWLLWRLDRLPTESNKESLPSNNFIVQKVTMQERIVHFLQAYRASIGFCFLARSGIKRCRMSGVAPFNSVQ